MVDYIIIVLLMILYNNVMLLVYDFFTPKKSGVNHDPQNVLGIFYLIFVSRSLKHVIFL